MATNLELEGFLQDQNNVDKFTVAVLKKADALNKLPSPTAQQAHWAKAMLAKVYPNADAQRILLQLLLDNENASVNAINNVLNSDSQIQTAVSNFIDTNINRLATEAGYRAA